MIMWRKTVRTVPLQRTARGYRWCQGGHVIEVCLHRRTQMVPVQRHTSTTYQRMISGIHRGMVRRKVTVTAPGHLVACLDCPSVASLAEMVDDRPSSVLAPWMSIYPVAQGDGGIDHGPDRSSPVLDRLRAVRP